VTSGSSPTGLLTALRQTAAILDQRRQPWALVGGLAISIRVEPRFTRDVDLAVAVSDDAAAEALVRDLTAAGFALRASLEQQALGRLAAVRLQPPDQHLTGVVIDLLFASSGIESDICRDAEPLEISPGLVVPVAQAGHLVAMKVLAASPDRLQDELDLRALIPQLTLGERERATRAVLQIERIGAHRGKALSADLAQRLQPT
jgi:hypothetical protein